MRNRGYMRHLFPTSPGADSSDMEVITWEPMTWTKQKRTKDTEGGEGFNIYSPEVWQLASENGWKTIFLLGW